MKIFNKILFRNSFFKLLIISMLLVIGCTSYTRYTRPSYKKENKTKTGTYKEKKVRKTKGRIKKVENVKKRDFPRKKPRSFKKRIFENKLKRVVKSYLGVKYHYGGTSRRRGMDCSGFVWRVFQDLGKKDFPRMSSALLTRLGTPVLKKNARPGDLIFFKNQNKIDHVGIYLGDEIFVHSSRGKGVGYTSVYNDYFRKRFFCLRRVL